MGGLLGSGVERAGVNMAVPTICYKKLGTVGHKVYADEGGDMQLARWVRNDVMLLAPFLLSFWTASLLRHFHYLIPSAYYPLLTLFLGLFISLGQLYLVWTIYASY